MQKYILAALAAAGSAYAACSASATLTISNAADASALASCKTFTGNIAIATDTVDPINIPSVRTIRGDLIANNVSTMNQLGADSVEIITGTFGLNDVQTLSVLSFPKLTAVESIIWQGLPNLNGLNFDASVQQASRVDIQNTFLASLKGINLKMVDELYLANNGMLQEVDLQLGNVSHALTLDNNGDRLQASFPNLIWAYNLTFRTAPSVSLPSLKYVNGSMGFYETAVSEIFAANLTRVGGSFSLEDNPELFNLSFPLLQTIDGGFRLAENPKVADLTGFPALKNIGGAFNVSGEFESVALPSLGDVRGAFYIASTEDIKSECDKYKSVNGPNKIIKGKFTCESKPTASSGGGSGGSSTGSGSGTTSSGSAALLDVSSTAMMGWTGFLAAMLGLL
ncbi:hypothetical protein P152DRAFT_281335 [Eremomyces bilateralis CBS 781.70]|uniref:GPI-anchored cell wall organization protein Ecm33 n=1 Tax=Eremomyces bilateralis CBS 781.70 TaxID=1392243 RepID=A0A6G1G986_9PEZI|nr:uncharacterized protein P152DRAFT_281335 [Eremomyces bilateralis CBS 781.70]KAF1814604.1 hypothetical protein P152DRAFT_281335 [Eremomyces bilateralis CBS 781.70]